MTAFEAECGRAGDSHWSPNLTHSRHRAQHLYRRVVLPLQSVGACAITFLAQWQMDGELDGAHACGGKARVEVKLWREVTS